MTLARLQEILAGFGRLHITVVGDLFLDRWWEVDRSLDEPSVETGLTAYQDVYKRQEYSFILSLILLLVIATCVNPNFFSWTNVTNLFVQSSMVGLIAMGMSMIISAGQIDISVGAQLAIIGGFGIEVLNKTGSAIVMLLFCCAFGIVIGTINGLLVTKGHKMCIRDRGYPARAG